MNREPKTTSALPSRIGWISWGYCAGSYSRSASWTITIWPVACWKPVRRAAPLPWFLSWKTIVRSGSSAAISLEDLAGAVLRAVVDQDDLLRDRDGADLAEDLVDRVPLVVDRDHDREDQVVRDPIDPQPAADRVAEDADQPLPVLVFLSRRQLGRAHHADDLINRERGDFQSILHNAQIPH